MEFPDVNIFKVTVGAADNQKTFEVAVHKSDVDTATNNIIDAVASCVDVDVSRITDCQHVKTIPASEFASDVHVLVAMGGAVVVG